jgi:hypothetical protein
VNAHEIRAGVVYKDANVTVTAFATRHAMESYGYRFDTSDRSIVITGDTNPTDATLAAARVFSTPLTVAAWKTKPSWGIVAGGDPWRRVARPGALDAQEGRDRSRGAAAHT